MAFATKDSLKRGSRNVTTSIQTFICPMCTGRPTLCNICYIVVCCDLLVYSILTKSPAVPQQLYKTASRGLSAIAELLIFSYCEAGFDFDHITAVDMSLILHQSAKCYPNRTTHGRKKMTSYRFSRWRISAILDFRGSVMVL